MRSGNSTNTNDGISVTTIEKVKSKLYNMQGITGIILVTLLVTAFVISTFWTFLESAGFSGSVKIILSLLIIGFIISFILILVIMFYKKNQKINELTLLIESLEKNQKLNDRWNHLDIIQRNDEKILGELIEESNCITIFSSRSPTYFTQFNRILQSQRRTNPLLITIFVRHDHTPKRGLLLKESFAQWQGLCERVNFKMSCEMIVLDNWKVMLRGLLFDENKALFGLYTHDGSLTMGSEFDYVFIRNSDGDIPRLLLDFIIRSARILSTQALKKWVTKS